MGDLTSTSYRKGKKCGPGRPKGLPNKATVAAREAIGRFVDGNAGRLQEWLDAIATGKDENGNTIGKPDPEKAFTLFQTVIEYHVPKLSRSEQHHSGSIDHGLAALRELNGP